MLAVLLALGAAASFGGSDYAAGLAARQAHVVRVTATAEGITALLMVAVVPFVSRQAPSAPALAWGAAAGVSGVAGVMALYVGFRKAAFSVASSVSAVAAAAFSALAGLLSGERPGALSLAGIALAAPAIMAVSASGKPAENGAGAGRHLAGVMWGLAAGAGFGLTLIALNRAGSRTDLWPLVSMGLAAVLTAACIAAATGQLGLPPAGTRHLPVLAGVVAASGIFCYFLATHRGLLTVTAVIYSLYPAGTIVLARALSGERLTVARIAGLGLAAASVVMIAAAGGS